MSDLAMSGRIAGKLARTLLNYPLKASDAIHVSQVKEGTEEELHIEIMHSSGKTEELEIKL
jgi:hypothetical protein